LKSEAVLSLWMSKIIPSKYLIKILLNAVMNMSEASHTLVIILC